MTRKSNSFNRFWSELKRRKVVHVITVYAAVAFVILQLVNMVAGPLQLPSWTEALVIVLLFIGFVIAVFLSWIYDVTPSGIRKTIATGTVKNEDQKTSPVSDGWKIAAIVSVIIIIALVTFNFIGKGDHNTGISKLDKSIAILPFINDSPSDSNQYFINGVMEEILNNLQKIKSFSKVLSRTSTEQYKGQEKPTIPEIAKKLGVNYIVEGSGQKYGNSYRLRVQLIEAKNDKHIWAESYEKEILATRDIYSTQSQIAQEIAEELKAKITPAEKRLIGKNPTDNLEAYNLYLKGTYFSQMMTQQGLEKASECFEQALQRDPDYALAYIGLSQFNGTSTFWGNVPPDKGFPIADEYVNKALKIDSSLAEAYWQLGNFNTFYYWNWHKAESNYKHAIRINPNSSLIHTDYANLLTITGRHQEAITESNRAQELDPLSPFINTRTGVALFYGGQVDKAIENYQLSLSLNPDYFYTHFELGNAYLAKEMFKEAISEFERAVELSEGNPFVTATLICIYYGNENFVQAEKLFEILKKRAETVYVPATCFFLVHRFRGEEDLAIGWLKRALAEHDTFLPMIRNNSAIFPERSKYIELINEAGL